MAIVAGQTIGSYRIVEQIGRGGMATVYKAFQSSLSRYVAIKVLPSAFQDDRTFLERFHQEAILIANLRHPNILVLFDSGEHDGIPYIVSDLIEGGTLADRMRGPMALDRAIGFLKPVGAALDFA